MCQEQFVGKSAFVNSNFEDASYSVTWNKEDILNLSVWTVYSQFFFDAHCTVYTEAYGIQAVNRSYVGVSKSRILL